MRPLYLCPIQNFCCWEGFAEEIPQHFKISHEQLFWVSNSFEIFLNEVPNNHLLQIDNEFFLIQTAINRENILIIKLRFLGSHDDARSITYDLEIDIDNTIYQFYKDLPSVIIPKLGCWEVNLKNLEETHGTMVKICCTVLLKNSRKRKISEASLKINNEFVESNLVDIYEEEIFEDLENVTTKISQLRQEKEIMAESEIFLRQNSTRDADCIDRISQLNLSVLEETFQSSDFHTVCDSLTQDNLNCPSCNLTMLPPIYLCGMGHSTCSWCKNSPCKICDSNITDRKNIELENISRTHLHKCRYSVDGCHFKLIYTDLRAHEAKCTFCKYKCKALHCPFEGRYDLFYNHIKIVHSSIKSCFNTKNDFPKNTEIFVLNQTLGIFYCKSELTNDFIIWRAYFCGPSVRQFSVSLSFKGSKYNKELIFKRKGNNLFEIRIPVGELKKNKAKDKAAILTITTLDA